MRYLEALPWANSIARQVLERRMPPWLPDDGAGDFAHARTLDERETDLLGGLGDRPGARRAGARGRARRSGREDGLAHVPAHACRAGADRSNGVRGGRLSAARPR